MIALNIMNGQYFTSFDGAKIYYHSTKRDKSKWLILLHGFGGDLTAWEKERAYFNKLNISTIAIDLRGHGLSQRSSSKEFYKLENFTKDVEVLIRRENIKNPVVVGHCFGGMVAIYFQVKFPNYSQGLVLIDTSYKPPFFSFNPVEKTFLIDLIELFLKFLPDIKIAKHRNFAKFIGTPDINIQRILSDILHTSLRSYLILCENIIDSNAKELLGKINVPTLIIEGTNDTIFPPDIARYLNKRIKRSELKFIAGANHILVLNNPAELEKTIENFLKKISFI